MSRRSPKPDATPGKPKYERLKKKCKYCRLEFQTPATFNGQKMDFCKPSHRWAFSKEGKQPIGAILKKQEKRLREICREEIALAHFQRLASGAGR